MWDLSLARIVHFHLDRGRGEQEIRVAKGDELRIKYKNEWEATGVVLRVAPNHEIATQLQRGDESILFHLVMIQQKLLL